MFRLTREVRFAINTARHSSAAVGTPTNAYAGYPSINGLAHYFTLAVTVAGDLDPDSSYLLNIKDIDKQVRERALWHVEEVVRLGSRDFGAPLLRNLFELLRGAWLGPRIEEIRLALSPLTSIAAFAKERPMTRLSQKFEFAASHRLHNPALSDEQNRLTFGKCNNPHGHGHNYELQVTLVGAPANNSGLLIDIPAFEQIVAETVINRFDHKNLNLQVEEFQNEIPSIENIARVIYRLLKPKLQSDRTKLASVTVWETPKTWCEYSEEKFE